MVCGLAVKCEMGRLGVVAGANEDVQVRVDRRRGKRATTASSPTTTARTCRPPRCVVKSARALLLRLTRACIHRRSRTGTSSESHFVQTRGMSFTEKFQIHSESRNTPGEAGASPSQGEPYAVTISRCSPADRMRSIAPTPNCSRMPGRRGQPELQAAMSRLLGP